MIRSRVVALVVLGSLILAVAGQSIAQVRYVDEKGNSHWVEFENQVPNRDRDKITHREGAAAAAHKKASDKEEEADERRQEAESRDRAARDARWREQMISACNVFYGYNDNVPYATRIERMERAELRPSRGQCDEFSRAQVRDRFERSSR